MSSGTGDTPAFDFRAVGAGMLWGLGLMLLGAVVQGIVGYSTPLSGKVENWLAMAWQAVGPMVGGFMAARRAQGSGWLHGMLAGIAVVLSVAAAMGVHTALPTLAAVLKLVGIGGGAGALGGIAGVNSGK